MSASLPHLQLWKDAHYKNEIGALNPVLSNKSIGILKVITLSIEEGVVADLISALTLDLRGLFINISIIVSISFCMVLSFPDPLNSFSISSISHRLFWIAETTQQIHKLIIILIWALVLTHIFITESIFVFFWCAIVHKCHVFVELKERQVWSQSWEVPSQLIDQVCFILRLFAEFLEFHLEFLQII